MTVALEPTPRRHWQTDAACGNADPRLFDDDHVTREGAAYCLGCPVRAECVAWAIETDAEGGWGGLDKESRGALARRGWRFGMTLDPIDLAGLPPAPLVADGGRRSAPAVRPRVAPRRRAAASQPAGDQGQDRSALRPRPHQDRALADLTQGLASRAVDALQEGLAVHRRGQLIMACGTGKTLIGRWAAQRLAVRRGLVLLPSLQLVAQALLEWRRPSGWPFDPLVVCSDPTTTAGVTERGEDGVDPFADTTARSRQVTVTTDPTVAARFLKAADPDRPQVVFCTYHSAGVLRDAIRQAGTHVRFDLGILDEAHRVANTPPAAFRLALDDDAIPIEQRLFLTATPVLLGGLAQTTNGSPQEQRPLSMDDERVFGPVLHRLTYAQAIAEGLLCDYRVLVVAEHAEAGQDADSAVSLAALRDAVTRFGLRRILTFHNRVAAAEQFAALINADTSWAGDRKVWAEAVRGQLPVARRRAVLRRLEVVSDGQVGVVSNARCLSEGIDVPAVDGVLFADPRRSVVDIVQAVGRVLRRGPGKEFGTIVIPVVLPADVDDDEALLASSFAPVWAVLRALRAHDERLAAQLDELSRRAARRPRAPAGHRRLPAQVQLLLPPTIPLATARLRLVQEAGGRWEYMFGLLARYVDEHGHSRVPGRCTVDGQALGQWVTGQRSLQRRGLLPAARAERLDALPGWRWSGAASVDDRSYAILASHVARVGTARENPTAPSIYAGAYDGAHKPLGRWAARQRQAWRAGTIAPDLAERLDALPGWEWTPLPNGDVAMVDALGAFVQAAGHANPPDGHVQDDLELGTWVTDVRRRKLIGTLHPALEDEILAVTPPKEHTDARFLWDKPETQWRLGWEALERFVAREGHAGVPTRHAEPLPDITVNLGQWCSLLRYQHRRGRVPADRAERLASLPGWTWTRTIARLPPADLADEVAPGMADALPARARLRKLADLGVTRPILARETGLPVLRIAGLLDGHTSELPPAEVAVILRLSTDRAAELQAAPAAAVVPAVGWDEAWEHRFELLAHWARTHGHARPRSTAVVDGVPLGSWVTQQRSRHRRGRLPHDRAERLAALPGWIWTTRRRPGADASAHDARKVGAGTVRIASGAEGA
jgi:superfamily II DNA or RNA helicase